MFDGVLRREGGNVFHVLKTAAIWAGLVIFVAGFYLIAGLWAYQTTAEIQQLIGGQPSEPALDGLFDQFR